MDRRTFLACALLALATSAAPGARGAWRRDNREACAKLDARLKEVESQRRMGYTAKQGRTLAARREALEQQRRDQCR